MANRGERGVERGGRFWETVRSEVGRGLSKDPSKPILFYLASMKRTVPGLAKEQGRLVKFAVAH